MEKSDVCLGAEMICDLTLVCFSISKFSPDSDDLSEVELVFEMLVSVSLNSVFGGVTKRADWNPAPSYRGLTC